MLLPQALPAERTGEQGHLKRQQKTLLARHGTMNLKLHGPSRGAGVGGEHQEMSSRCGFHIGLPRPARVVTMRPAPHPRGGVNSQGQEVFR